MRDIGTSPRIIEIKRKRRQKRIKALIIYFLIFVAIVAGLSFLSKEKHIVVDNVVVTGTHIIDQEEVIREIRKNLSGKYLFLFSKSNSFIFPEKAIYNNLLLKFPRIEKLSLKRDSLKTIQADIIERTGSFLYCGDKVPEDKKEIGENCYFINNDGYIFDEAPYFSGDVYFKYYIPLSKEMENPLGNNITDEEHFYRITRFIDGINSLGLKPVYIVIEKDGTDYLYLESNGTNPVIQFKDNDNLTIILDNLLVAMQKKEFADEIKSKYNTLQYIDLRFKNKVLYKFEG